MPVIMILKKDINHALMVNGKKCIVYNKRTYKPIKRFLSSDEAIQYAHENKCGLIVSIIDKEPSRWLIMEEVTDGKR